MTNREMLLLATSIIFASTTAGLVLKGALCHHHMRPGMERFEGGPRGPEGMRGPRDPKFDMFTRSDADKDGFVTKEEMLAGQKARLDEFFTTVDTNHDGKLSRDEMEKGRELMRARFEAKRKAAEAGSSDTAPATDASPSVAPAPAPAQ